MQPPLKERLGLAEPRAASEGRTDRAVMARSLMYVFAAGATITMVTLAFPNVTGADEGRILVTAGCAYAIALVLLLGYDDVPLWAFHLFLALATLLIEWTVYASGDPTSPFSMFYFWIAIYAFYFFTRVRAFFQILFVGLAYAAQMVFMAEAWEAPVQHWAVTTVALVVAGALIGLQRTHVDKLIRRLGDTARTDMLTRLLNRRGFVELFEQELERAKRNARPLTLVVADLDGFKDVNDGYGHHEGDEALERFGGIARDVKRRIDTAARIGGEEFAFILPETDASAAYIVAERLRREVGARFEDKRYELTISLGVASYPAHGDDAEALMKTADRALYAAKELGRDRTVIFNPEISETLSLADAGGNGQQEPHTSTVLALAEVLDIRDSGTASHSQTVGRYAEAIARELGLPDEQVSWVRFAAIVHDVGKIGIPDSVLRKAGWLEEQDWEEMRRHPEIGARILDGANLHQISDWVLSHHERPDGRGYPRGLKDGEIPIEAKILAVADAYEAMTCDRVYRPALAVEAAREELRRHAGTQFDERVVDAFLAILEREEEPADAQASARL
jgi:diguanylate cyclase (GGDEF)-like protein/putative nucleotidyltransferase with HDIG domain